MKFKELLDKYKNHTATEEEKELIERELEKYEAIEEYLSKNFGMDFMESFEEESKVHEISMIKKSVNKRLRKVVLASVSIVLLIFISIFYVVSPIMDGMYYNPTAHTISEYRDDFHFDLTAFTELNLPGYVVSTVLSENKGFGKYNIYYFSIFKLGICIYHYYYIYFIPYLSIIFTIFRHLTYIIFTVILYIMFRNFIIKNKITPRER